MIDLRCWREVRLLHYRLVALFIISSCYMLIITPAMIYLPRMQRQKEVLNAELKQLGPHQQAISETTREQVVAINRLTWSTHEYVLTLMHRLANIPTDVVLVSLNCYTTSCVFDIASDQLQRLMRVFTNNELRDLKQGGCPLCYHAKINVILS